MPSFSLRRDGGAQERSRSIPGPSFLPVEAVPEPTPLVLETASPVRGSAKRWDRRVALGIMLAVALMAGCVYWLRPVSALDHVWAPFFSTKTPVLLTIGEPSLGPAPQLLEPQPMTVREHLSKVDYLVFSDVQALGLLTGLLDRKGWPHRLQLASVTSFADMRQGPAILIGGLDNPWSLRALATTRFRFAKESSGLSWIEDQRAPGDRRWLVDVRQPYAQLTEDYAIVARFVEPDTGQIVMVVAGVGENGTKAAAEFMTDPMALRVFSGKEQNVEVVLGTTVVRGVSGPPRVLARAAW